MHKRHRPQHRQTQLLKPAELDQLVAPIALYPDTLLAEVLMASAYPLDIVQAERWVQANKNLAGDQLKAAVDKQPWDASVKSLVATPSVLEMMSTKLDWTEKLGDAVVAQQADVMDAVQRLRAKAQANNKLTSTKEQNVTVQQAEGRQVIAIEPTDPNTVYVPYYDPGVVYGDWPYPEYPPYYFGAPGYIGAGVIATGIAFGAGYALGRWGAGGRYWGGGVNWGGNNLVVNRPIGGGNNIGNRWQPRVEHRQRTGNRGGGQQLNFRGSGGQQVLKPGGGGRTNAGERHGAGNRQAAGNKGSRGGHHVAHTNRGGGHGSHARLAAVMEPRCAPAAAGVAECTLAAVAVATFGPAEVMAAECARRRSWRRRRPWWWRTALGHQAQARRRAPRLSRQRSWLLSLQLQRQRQGLCRGDGAGSAAGHAGGRRARFRRLSASLLREARSEGRELQPLDQRREHTFRPRFKTSTDRGTQRGDRRS